jgi:hypothetical protein
MIDAMQSRLNPAAGERPAQCPPKRMTCNVAIFARGLRDGGYGLSTVQMWGFYIQPLFAQCLVLLRFSQRKKSLISAIWSIAQLLNKPLWRMPARRVRTPLRKQ